ncbi:MAG: dTMP kinase [Candidatus Melainabacteria bacterium RIFCSPHIGHO2_02_FULL_34_12]|nr:MAG: dTMP kinase [Candidatus Melainabacteria bacterium RIFCSPHIGHO2_02_FULL_34_12]
MYFITFEGIDGSGKTTQIDLLKKHFSGRKDVIFTANPGETQLGKELRKILLHRNDLKLSEINEMFLFFTGIQDNYEKVILPAISQEKNVLCDRYYDSTIAYQGFGRRLDINKILKLVEVTALPEPNLTILFRIDFDVFLERAEKKASKDKIESSKSQFYKSVISGYDELAKIHKNRYVVLDGLRPIELLHKQVIEVLKDRLNIC